jgi:hypothetical protein
MPSMFPLHLFTRGGVGGVAVFDNARLRMGDNGQPLQKAILYSSYVLSSMFPGLFIPTLVPSQHFQLTVLATGQCVQSMCPVPTPQSGTSCGWMVFSYCFLQKSWKNEIVRAKKTGSLTKIPLKSFYTYLSYFSIFLTGLIFFLALGR